MTCPTHKDVKTLSELVSELGRKIDKLLSSPNRNAGATAAATSAAPIPNDGDMAVERLQAFVKAELDRRVPFQYNHSRPDVYPFPEFTRALAAPNFAERFKALTFGLDDESLATVARIVNRIRRIGGRKGTFDFFTHEEKEFLSDIRDNFAPQIVKLADDLFMYKKFFLPQNKFDVSVFYHKNGLNYLDKHEYFANKDIIDAGAFIGDSVVLLSPLTRKNVYCFEAMAKNFKALKQTISLNGLLNVVPEHLALGASTGRIKIKGFVEKPGSTTTCDGLCLIPEDIQGTPFTEKVAVETLDTYVFRKNLEPGLIKVDIEGAEQPMLRGAVETIKKYRPSLLISIYHNPEDFFEIKPLIENWGLGYKFKIANLGTGGIFAETLLIGEIG